MSHSAGNTLSRNGMLLPIEAKRLIYDGTSAPQRVLKNAVKCELTQKAHFGEGGSEVITVFRYQMIFIPAKLLAEHINQRLNICRSEISRA